MQRPAKILFYFFPFLKSMFHPCGAGPSQNKYPSTEPFRTVALIINRGYISSQVETKDTGQHFKSPGHSLSEITITDLYRKKRENYFLNRQP